VQQSSGKDVAVKILRQGPLADQEARSRLQREIAVMAALNHPNIVSVIDHGVTPEGLDYLVTNFIDGKPFDEFFQAKGEADGSTATLSESLKVFIKLCAAMHAAHLHGIVHRELSPSKILIDAQGEPHILDFGLARTAFDRYIGGEDKLSSIGQFIGKPHYASPEQLAATRN
jgi:serine/threonine protein kinase